MKKLLTYIISRKIIFISILFLLTLLIVVVLNITSNNKLITTNAFSDIPNEVFGNVKVGTKAPDFELANVMGGNNKLSTLKKYTVLLSFIQVHSASESNEAQGTRSQVNFLKSMNSQYSSKGLKVILVDSSYIKNHKNSDNNTQINFTYDWMLENIPLLSDSKSSKVAEMYGVTLLPTTFLINSEGVITQRWDNVALTSQMAAGIEALIGEPEYRTKDNKGSTTTVDLDTSSWSTPAQTKLSGYLSARQFSDNIWAIDGGSKWSGSRQFPVTWIIFNKGSGDLILKVVAKNTETGKTAIVLDNQRPEILPADEAKILLTNFPDVKSSVYKLDTPVTLPGTGKIELEAFVYEKGNNTPILTGKARVMSK